MGQGYVLSVTCGGSEGATKVPFGAGARRETASTCDCVQAEPDGMSALQKKWFLQ